MTPKPNIYLENVSAAMEDQRREVTPEQDALEHIAACRDKHFLEKRYIDVIKGRMNFYFLFWRDFRKNMMTTYWGNCYVGDCEWFTTLSWSDLHDNWWYRDLRACAIIPEVMERFETPLSCDRWRVKLRMSLLLHFVLCRFKMSTRFIGLEHCLVFTAVSSLVLNKL